MKWTTTSWRTRTDRLEKTMWRRWFAWYPVEIDNMTVWLETVEKKGRIVQVGDQSILQYSYRLIRRQA